MTGENDGLVSGARRLRKAELDDRAARVAGLPADARVITLGAGFVRDGQRVEITA